MGKTLNLVALLAANTVASSVYSIVAPYFPSETNAKGISSAMVGFFFSSYSIATLIASISIGKCMKFIGKEYWLLARLSFNLRL